MERASRLILVASIALAGIAHAWLARWQPALGPAALVAFAGTFVLARWSFTAATAIVLGSAYLAPALLSRAFGTSDYHLMLVWLAALAGTILAHADLTRWHLPREWTIPVAAWVLVVACTWPIVAAREVDFSVVAATTLETTNVAFPAPPAVAAAFVIIFALAQMLGLLWMDVLWMKFTAADAPRFARAVFVPSIVSVALSALAGIYQATLDINWLNPPMWAALQRAGGLVLDANTFGTGAAIWAPSAVVAVWLTGGPAWLGAAAFGLLGAGMWSAASRTGLLAFTLGAAGVVIALLHRRGLWHRRMAGWSAAAIAVTALVVLTLVPRDFDYSSPLARALDRVPRLDAADLRRFADELWNRYGYGRAAAQMIGDYPLTGVGVGAFHVVAPDYLYRESQQIVASDNAQNWWRHQVAELGVVGALPSLWMSIVLVVLLVRSRGAPDPSGAATVLRLVIVGFGLASMLGVPTQHPATWISVVSIIVLFATSVGVDADPRTASPARSWWIAAFLVAAIAVAGQMVSGMGGLRVPARAAWVGLPYHYGMSAPEGLSDAGEMRWIRSEAVAVVEPQERWLQLTFWPAEPDGEPTRVRVAIEGRNVLEEQIAGAEPTAFFVEVPDEGWTILEFAASPAREPYAVGVAQQWRAELPPEVPAERVIRR